MNRRLIIREASTGDLARLSELLGILFSLEQDFTSNPARQERGLARLLNRDQARVLTAEARGRVIGVCTGQSLIFTAEGGPAVLVEDVVVDEAWRGRGVGGRLLAALSDWAAGQRAKRLQLLADRDNHPALEFYRKLGWERTNLVCLRRRRVEGD
jgi:GNAT superfamily N-acetyltransferase